MQNTSTLAELTFAIQLLEEEKAKKELQLKHQFHVTYESLKPINILKNTIQDVSSSINVTDSIIGALMGVASGYLTKKVAVGSSHNFFRKMLGSFLQVGVTTVVSNHPETVKSIGEFLYKNIFHKKDSNETPE